MREIRRFQPEHNIVSSAANFERRVVLKEGAEKINIKNKKKRAGVINRSTLQTNENFEKPTSPRNEQFGHLAEFWLAEDLKKLPGVKDVVLADNITDSEKMDAMLILKGGVEVPLQITTNPRMIERKIKEAGKNTMVVCVTKEDFEKSKEDSIPALNIPALKRVGRIFMKKMTELGLLEELEGSFQS
ncbi:MAG: hypothetical protein Q8N55_01535 [bacterium]|nr:hypothetical protein [bacterium]